MLENLDPTTGGLAALFVLACLLLIIAPIARHRAKRRPRWRW